MRTSAWFTGTPEAGSRKALASPTPSQPESCPQQSRFDPVGEFGNQRGGFAPNKRQAADKRPAPSLGRNGTQSHLIPIAGTHHPAKLSNAVDQAALQRLAPGPRIAGEKGVVLLIDLAGAAAANMVLEGLMDIL